jgi:signal transduction histidine kinase
MSHSSTYAVEGLVPVVDRFPSPVPREEPRDEAVREVVTAVPVALGGRSRRQLVSFAAAMVGLYPVDIFVLGYASGRTLAVRMAWALSLVLNAWLSQRASPSAQRVLAIAQAGFSSAFFLLLIHFTGGMASPFFYSIPMMPLIIAVIDQHNTPATLVSGGLCVVGTLALVVASGGTVPAMVTWTAIVMAATFFSSYAVSQVRKTQAAEAQARVERARREALEQLALSERRRTQSEKLATVGRLAANVVHEINNPLTFIRANVEFLQREMERGALAGPQPKHVAEMFEEVAIGIERIRQITADLKGFTYMDGEELTECRLSVAVADAARLASLRLKGVARLTVDVPESLPLVHAIHRRLAQVLLNLLVNAGDALAGAGVAAGEVRVTGREEGGRVVVLIEDNGPGFSPEVLPRLFEAFFTTKGPGEGTGLGLALSREMMEQFGGTLHAENRAEGGACLRLELPVYTPGRSTPRA